MSGHSGMDRISSQAVQSSQEIEHRRIGETLWIMLPTFDVAKDEQGEFASRLVIFSELCWKAFMRVIKCSRHDL